MASIRAKGPRLAADGLCILFILFLLGRFASRSIAWDFLPEKGRLIYRQIDAVGFLSDQRPEGIGRIVSAKQEQALLLGQNDEVYLDVGSRRGIKKGDLLTVFRVTFLGLKEGRFAVQPLGLIKVIQVDDIKSEGRILESYRPISIGDRVIQYRKRSAEVPLHRAAGLIEGKIVRTDEGEPVLGMGNLVFIDKGSREGVRRGSCFTIYRYPKGRFRGRAERPLINKVGELIVLVVGPRSSTALVTESTLPLEWGERIRAPCDWQLLAEKKEAEREEKAFAGLKPVKRPPPAVPAPKKPAKVAVVERPTDEEVRSFEAQDIYFKFDRYNLTESARKILIEKSQWLRRYPKVKVLIEGHCDERGTNLYNLALGDRRAYVAKKFLIMLGIEENRLRTISYGEERPFDPRHNEEAWARNRRAHFVVIER